MEIVYVKDGRYDEYENMLMERDRYRKEVQMIFRQYLHEFGDMIAAVFKQKIACIEKKKMLSYCMVYFNRGESVDMSKVQEQIKHDMAEYQSQLEDMIAGNEACRDMKRIPESEVLKIRQKYRRIAKKLHPDLNPLTEQHEELMELWLRNLTAYQCNDLKEIEEVEFLVDQALAALGEGKTIVSIPDIDEKIESLYKEIEKIKSTDPYLYKEILGDDSLIKEKTQALENELNEYITYAEQLDQQLKQFIVEGGTFTWTN
ncbi:MAG: hypothetical protein KBA55_13285 [Ruminococcus sp.]|nr:hypothetical protein [Ruminococcus sp.]